MSLLPILFWCLAFAILMRAGLTWRGAFLGASLAWGIAVTAITEILSLFEGLTRLGVLTGWLGLTLLLLTGLLSATVRTGGLRRPETGKSEEATPFDMVLKIGLAAIGSIVLAVGVTAFIAPPNTADSMQYHMSRVMHWIQNGSVAHYPTHILRQLFMKPWAEYAILNFQILSGGDRFANGVQWFSWVGCLVGISLVSRYLGMNLRAQLFTALIAATIPMAILQGSSTQNDLVLSFWLVCLVASILGYQHHPRRLKALAVGASLGLAVLTKPIGYLYAFPFMVWFLILAFRTRGNRVWQDLILTGAVMLALNAADYVRTMTLLGWPLASRGDNYLNALMTFPAWVSNLVRNMSIHWGLPFEAWNHFLEQVIGILHRWMGIGVNDPRTTMVEVEFAVHPLNTNEDMAGNPLHFVLASIGLAMFLGCGKHRRKYPFAVYMVCLVTGILLLSSVTTFQTFSSRFYLPAFILFAAPPAMVLTNLKWRKIPLFLAVLIFAASWYWVGYNEFRPLMGERSILKSSRTAQYFYNRPDLQASYLKATAYIRERGYTRVGLLIRPFADFEYPFWVLLKPHPDSDMILRHVDVINESGHLAKHTTSEMDAILCTGFTGFISRERIQDYVENFGPMRVFGRVYLFERQGTVPNWDSP